MSVNVQKIHEATMWVLENVGIEIHHEDIIELLKKHGVRTDGSKAFFTEAQVMEWVGKAPSSFTLYARNENHNMLIGGGAINYVPAESGFPFITDYTGKERPALMSDYVDFIKLVQQIPFFHIAGGVMVTPNDLPTKEVFPTLLLSLMVHSDKCIFGGMGGTEETQRVMDMFTILFGAEDLKQHPRAITIISSASPLSFAREMLDTLISYVQHGQAVVISPAVMAGTTGPVTMAGTMVVSNAESLIGVVIAQMLTEGTPVVYGSATSGSDMRDGTFCIGSPESTQAIRLAKQLATFYGLPCRAGGALTDNRCHTMQTGAESMATLLVSVQSNVDFMIHSAGVLGGYRSLSYEKFLADVEMIGMVEHITKELLVDDDSLALDVIQKVGPGKEFMSAKHTMKNFRKAHWHPQVSLRGNFDSSSGDHLYQKALQDRKDSLLNSYIYPDLDQKIIKELSGYLTDHGYAVFV